MDRALRCTVAALAAAVLVGCGGDGPFGPGAASFDFSFERSLEGWEEDATDLDSPPVDWTVTRSDDRAELGGTSVRLTVNNVNDKAKIWIERAYTLRPNTTYRVDVTFDLATEDFGGANTWNVIAGVHAESPEVHEDLTFRGETGNGADSDVGYVWTERSHSFTAATGDDGTLHTALGVWGTFEVERTYYIDDVRVVFRPTG